VLSTLDLYFGAGSAAVLFASQLVALYFAIRARRGQKKNSRAIVDLHASDEQMLKLIAELERETTAMKRLLADRRAGGTTQVGGRRSTDAPMRPATPTVS